MNTNTETRQSLKKLLPNVPQDWLKLTTHRLDIYNESNAKSEFLTQLKERIKKGQTDTVHLDNLPTAYDYIRLGHQLSSLLEWVLAEINQLSDEQVIAFASKSMPILAVLRHNTMNNKTTHIYFDGESSPLMDETRLKEIYGYQYQLTQVADSNAIPHHDDEGTVIYVTQQPLDTNLRLNVNSDLTVNIHPAFGSFIFIHTAHSEQLVSAIQHVRRRETIALSPLNSYQVLQELAGNKTESETLNPEAESTVVKCIRDNTDSGSTPLVASSGLSIQYAILMGLVEQAKTEHPGKPINIILPPNCYGGTNDQSRRVADLIPEAAIVDLPVDGGADLVNSLETALATVAEADGVPIVLTEIPTNPRVEVPDMTALSDTLNKPRHTLQGNKAVPAIFAVDQTFCPNVPLLGTDSELANVKTISFTSGSKFPSGGRCIAGYCAANQAAEDLMPLIAAHLTLSDNQADAHQINTLAQTMPSMPERIDRAFENTRKFVRAIRSLLPSAKIFYVTDDMAQKGFKPSVFSLDLPVEADTRQEQQERQKELNKKLIAFMIQQHPKDCKNCVSYGQLKGSYWTIPATSTQGTTKEEDKDYVVRISISPDVDVTKLIDSFKDFCREHDLL
ncbi:MAG: hypothetical protein ACK5L8_00760 [Marinicella pacifica]